MGRKRKTIFSRVTRLRRRTRVLFGRTLNRLKPKKTIRHDFGRGLTPAPSAQARKLMNLCAKRIPVIRKMRGIGAERIEVQKILSTAEGRKPDLVWDDIPNGIVDVGKEVREEFYRGPKGYVCVALLNFRDPESGYHYHSAYFMRKAKTRKK